MILPYIWSFLFCTISVLNYCQNICNIYADLMESQSFIRCTLRHIKTKWCWLDCRVVIVTEVPRSSPPPLGAQREWERMGEWVAYALMCLKAVHLSSATRAAYWWRDEPRLTDGSSKWTLCYSIDAFAFARHPNDMGPHNYATFHQERQRRTFIQR